MQTVMKIVNCITLCASNNFGLYWVECQNTKDFSCIIMVTGLAKDMDLGCDDVQTGK
jgi:hypothetical protein